MTMLRAEIVGARTISQRSRPRSASAPNSGLISEGICWSEASVPAAVSDRPKFSMIRGRSGAIEDEKISWVKCPAVITNALPVWDGLDVVGVGGRHEGLFYLLERSFASNRTILPKKIDRLGRK